MPLDIAVPTWYNDDSYINEKVDECNTIKFGAVEGEEFTPWTAASVRDFLAAANGEADYQPWMGYANFVSNGNAENCSPNPLFNVMQYVTAKAAQLNSINYDGRNADNNPWTAQNVLDFFNAHDITAWDHFTTAGQFENVNPSNAMDLSDFLASKAKECNDIEFDGRNDWDEQAVLDYYQQHGLNAVMVAVSASDPNVIAVPEAEQVTPPVGITPWGVAVMPVDVELTTGVDVMPENAAPINYIGTVVNTNSSSTLNPNDQINGGNAADELTVNMDRSWIGFNDGFVKDVPTVNLNNETASGRNLNFNAENIEGVDTWNVNGNVSLSNLEKAGITVNLSNVNGDNPYNLNFDADAVKGGNDSLTLGINNMPEYVTVNGNGIEHVTVNSTGDVENYVWLKGMDGAKSVKITGDGEANVALSPTVTTIDATEAGADTFVCTRYSDLVESIRMGKGDDSFTLRSITPNAVVDGGDGQDTGKLFNTSGAYQLQMSNVETLNITVGKNYAGQADPDPSAALSLDGGLTTGLETLGLTGGNGYAFDGTAADARSISLSNYDVGELTVAVTKQNNVDLNITGIEEITVNVGDGKATDTANNVPLDQLTGTVTLPDAQNVAINIADINNPGNAKTEFDAALVAGKAGSLSLTSGQNAGIQIQGGDLSAVSQLTISGYYDTTIQNANLSQNAKSVYVDAQGQIGGIVTTSFTGNEANGGATLNYDGSTTGENDLTVDNTYSAINVVTGINSDTLTLDAGTGFKYTQQNLTGNLGSGDDTIVVKGTVDAGSDFTGLAGVETIKFEGKSLQEAQKFVAENNIKTGDAVIAGSFVDKNDVPIVAGESGEIYGLGGDQTFLGVIDTTGNMTLNGNTLTDAGGANISFGTGEFPLNITNVGDLTINGGSDTNTIIGTPTNINGNFIVNDAKGTAADTIDLTGISATGKVEIIAPEAGMKNAFTATVAKAGTGININTNGAASSTIRIVQPTTGNVTVAAQGEGKDAVTLDKFEASKLEQTLTITLNDKAQDTVTVAADTDLTGWTTSITGAAITLAGKANLGDLSGITDSTISGGTLQLSGDLDLTKSSLNITSGVDIADGKTLTVGQGFAPEGAITGDGTLAVAGGTAEATVDLSAVKVAADVALVINEGATVQVGANFGDASKAVGSKAISGDGTLEFKADATAFETGSTISTNIKVDEGATLTLGGGWDGSYAKVISGPGAVQNGDGKAWDLIGDNALGFIGDNLTLNVVTGGTGIKLGEVEATNVFKVSGDGNVTVDLSGGTGETANLTGITANTSSSFTGTFNVSMDQKDSVTLSDNAAEVITIAGSDLTGFDSADDALTVYGFGTGDTVKLAGALTGIAFDSTKGAAADATTPVTVVDDKIYVLTGFEGDVTTTTLGDIFGNAKAFKYASSDADIVLAVAGDDSTSLYSVATSTSAVTDVQLIGTFNGMNVTVADAGNIFVS